MYLPPWRSKGLSTKMLLHHSILQFQNKINADVCGVTPTHDHMLYFGLINTCTFVKEAKVQKLNTKMRTEKEITILRLLFRRCQLNAINYTQ